MFDVTLLVQQALAHADHALRDMDDRRCPNIARVDQRRANAADRNRGYCCRDQMTSNTVIGSETTKFEGHRARASGDTFNREAEMATIFKIHPAIGSARVGNSAEFYLAPEAPGTLPLDRNTGKPIYAGPGVPKQSIFHDAT